MSLKNRIKDGLSGVYEGLDNGLERANHFIYGVQRKTITLVGALSGAGKTTLVDFMVLRAIKDAKVQNIPIHVFYYSYEIDEETKKINWLSAHIYNKYKVVIPPEVIAGLGKHEMTIEQQELVDSEIDYIEQIFSEINFRFDPTNPTGIYKDMYNHAVANGTFSKAPYKDDLGNTKYRITGYTANNPNEYVIGVIDHIALAKIEKGKTLKENIDKLSEYWVWLRNICNYSFFPIQQFNQGINNIDRAKFKGIDLSPQQTDFKDSTNPYTDADVVLGIMNPWKMDFKEYDRYDLTYFKGSFRSLKIIKNRRGKDNMSVGLLFKPQGGHFEELPRADDFICGIKNYTDYINKL
jgi:hypothetical protein